MSVGGTHSSQKMRDERVPSVQQQPCTEFLICGLVDRPCPAYCKLMPNRLEIFDGPTFVVTTTVAFP